jgi:hypothetical protein
MDESLLGLVVPMDATLQEASSGDGCKHGACGSSLRVRPRAYGNCVIQTSLCSCSRLMSILSRATLRSDSLTNQAESRPAAL